MEGCWSHSCPSEPGGRSQWSRALFLEGNLKVRSPFGLARALLPPTQEGAYPREGACPRKGAPRFCLPDPGLVTAEGLCF